MTAQEWLAAHDPKYISPQQKAARTRETPYSPMALAAMMGGTGLRRVGGKVVQCLSVGFEGGTEDEVGQAVPITEGAQESLDQARQIRAKGVRRRGKRGGKQARKSTVGPS